MRYLALVVLGMSVVAAAEAGSDVTLAKPACAGKSATIVGSARADARDGTRGADVIVGLGGRDSIDGRAGDDRICGGAGDDVLTGSSGKDVLDGGSGFDVCRSGERRVSCEETRPAPHRGALLPGEYFFDAFAAPFSFAIAEQGWSVNGMPTYGQLLMGTRFDPGGTTITADGMSTSQSVANRIGQLSAMPGTTATSGQAVEIGGASGRRVTVTVTASDLVLVPGFFDRYELEPSDKAEFYALDVGGRTVTLAVEAPKDEFPTWLSRAEAVLDSIRFRRG